MTNNFTVEKVHDILLGYVLEQGESIWEELEGDFYKNEEKYLDFLVSQNYITATQKENWIKNRYDDSDYENIEAMTYMGLNDFPYDLMKENGLIKSDFELDYDKAKALGMINVPIFIHTTDVEEFNIIYWEKVLLVMAEYLQSDLETYGEKLKEMSDLVDYYRG